MLVKLSIVTHTLIPAATWEVEIEVSQLGKKGYQDSVSKNKLAMVAFAVIPAI
jgi:hypothetical protein